VALLYDIKSSKVSRCFVAIREVCIPYIPGLLAFREMYLLVPAILRVLKEDNIDLFLVDGHGISHPRGLGIASHVGVVFEKPSIGVAKKKLVGKEVLKDGNYYVELEGKPVAAKVRTPEGSWIYVSPGHLVTLNQARDLVIKLFRPPYKLPYPLYLADAVSKASKKLLSVARGLKVVSCPIIL
jgi:deoxyribonuclease V